MRYEVRTTKHFIKSFLKLDQYTQKMLKTWIVENLVNTDNPQDKGKSLKGNLKGLWRYRIGDYRLICIIVNDKLIITALNIGHIKDIYR